MQPNCLLILGLVSIVDIGSVQISSNIHTHLKPNFRRYPTVFQPTIREKSRSRHFDNSPKTIEKITDLPSNSNRRRIKIKLLKYSDNSKKPKNTKRSKNARRPHVINSNAWNDQNTRAKNLKYLNLPSTYLEPPKFDENADNYYGNIEKPEGDDVEKKNVRKVVGSLKNHRLHGEETRKDVRGINYVRDHAPELHVEASGDVRTTDNEESVNGNLIGTSESPKDRIEFHIHGHEGPQSYIFGYDTGEGDNRQFRLEERHEDGSVTGQYGYIDARGKLRKVRYKASPTEGYVEKHHETKEQEET